MHAVSEVASHALLITGFVFVMMLVIEYLNVLTRGNWDRIVARWKWGQTAFAALLGASPGCLGAFAVSSLYMHRVLTFGSLLAAMIATVGDETFIMLALFPARTFLILGVLVAGGVLAGALADLALGKRRTTLLPHLADYRPSHAGETECLHFSGRQLLSQWRRCSPRRGWLLVLLLAFLAGVMTGAIGHHHLGVEPDAHGAREALAEPADVGQAHGDGREAEWNWVRITLLALTLAGLFVVASVPDHFLEEHLWNHLARVHVWRIFLWTVGALAVTHLVTARVNIDAVAAGNHAPLLLLACLVGLIPSSGPHMVFVTLYAEGALPFSVLLANCIVQDGHGLIPLLSQSRRAVIAVKAVKLVIALAAGVTGRALGW
ncbi:MAG: hypothetical protein FJ225_05510 [Lentisphaerae bacterium]|nr:hypothetical protein [Lentisphaerota bacterium]